MKDAKVVKAKSEIAAMDDMLKKTNGKVAEDKLPYAFHAMGITGKDGKKYTKVIEREEFKTLPLLMARVHEVLDGDVDVTQVMISVA